MNAALYAVDSGLHLVHSHVGVALTMLTALVVAARPIMADKNQRDLAGHIRRIEALGRRATKAADAMGAVHKDLAAWVAKPTNADNIPEMADHINEGHTLIVDRTIGGARELLAAMQEATAALDAVRPLLSSARRREFARQALGLRAKLDEVVGPASDLIARAETFVVGIEELREGILDLAARDLAERLARGDLKSRARGRSPLAILDQARDRMVAQGVRLPDR